MMKTFDEYIQGRILKAYNNAPGEGICDKFDELAYWFKYDSIDNTARFMQRYGIGKQRAKDYAHYIVAWLEEQKEPLYTSAVAYANEPAIEQSHLTDEDARLLKAHIMQTLYAEKCRTDAPTQDNVDYFYTEKAILFNFINSLKGE